MTPRQKELVQASWAKVVPLADTAAGLFYGRLFELDPSLRPMFSSDLKEQGKKLMTMITVAVQGLDNLEALGPAVQALGKRHAGCRAECKRNRDQRSAVLQTQFSREYRLRHIPPNR